MNPPTEPDGSWTRWATCQRCRSECQVELVRTIAENGSSIVYWKCKFCGRSADGPNKHVAHADLKTFGIAVESVPIDKVNVRYGSAYKCRVRGCESYETEEHHSAPRAVFGDEADDWPMFYLCRKHHQEWHERMRVATRCSHEPIAGEPQQAEVPW